MGGSGVYRECTGGVPGVYRECICSPPMVYRECTGSVQGVQRVRCGCNVCVSGVYRECSGSAPGVYLACAGESLCGSPALLAVSPTNPQECLNRPDTWASYPAL